MAQPAVLVRIVIAGYLRACGYPVIEASTAEDVFTVLRTDITVDVVFSEVRLLRASGEFCLAEEIRKSRPEIDLILTFGVASAAQKVSELCEVGIVKERYDPQEIRRRIQILRERMRPSIRP